MANRVSIALKNGINIQLLAENMGTSVAMIEKHYGKFSRTTRLREVQAAVIDIDLTSELQPQRQAVAQV